MRRLILILGTLVCAQSLAAAQSGAILLVPGTYSTIYAAVEAAADGDTVLVAPGAYPGGGFWFLGKAIHVRSEAGPEATIIMNSSVICIDNERPDSIVEGFTIDGALGGGVYCEDSSPTIRNNIIKNCSTFIYGFGGGIYTFNAKPGETYSARIIGNRIEGNYGSRSGGGIMVRGAPAIIQDNVIANNSVGTPDFFLGIGLVGGGIALWGGDASIVENNLIYGNTAVDPFCCYGEGGGIGMYLADFPELRFNTIVGNTARTGGGVASISGFVTMTNSILFGNVSLVSDPSVYESLPSMQIAHNCIAGGYPGVGNFDADPQFEVGLAGDYYLSATSPCVDAGDPVASPPVGTTQVSQEFDIGIADLGYHAPIVLAPFRRGEVNMDGLVNIADGIFVLSWLFGVGSPAPVCFDAADANDDGLVDIADPIGLLTVLFISGSPPIPAPSAACGADTTLDALPCPDTGACAGFP